MNVKENDLFILYFAGHALFSKNANENFLLTSDTSKLALLETSLRFEMLRDILNKIPAKIKWVIIDACQQETLSGEVRSISADLINHNSISEGLPSNTYVMFSCGQGEVAYGDDELKSGIFSHYFTRGIHSRESQDSDGRITFFGLLKYLQEKVKEHNQRLGLDSQTPTWIPPKRPLESREVLDFLILEGTRKTSSHALLTIPDRTIETERHITLKDSLDIFLTPAIIKNPLEIKLNNTKIKIEGDNKRFNISFSVVNNTSTELKGIKCKVKFENIAFEWGKTIQVNSSGYRSSPYHKWSTRKEDQEYTLRCMNKPFFPDDEEPIGSMSLLIPLNYGPVFFGLVTTGTALTEAVVERYRIKGFKERTYLRKMKT